MVLPLQDVFRRRFRIRRSVNGSTPLPPPRKRKRVGKTLRAVGGRCFDYLTQGVFWEDEAVDRKELRKTFAEQFELVLREHESARLSDEAEIRRYGPVTIEGREGMPHYVKLTLRRMDAMPSVSWPSTSVIWIDFHPDAINVLVRDASCPFWQSLRSAPALKRVS